MRRLTVRLLSGSAALLTLIGCSSSTVTVSEDGGVRRVAVKALADAPAAEAKPAKKEAGEPFVLPDDGAGRLLGRVLPPRQAPGAMSLPAPPSAPAPRLVEPAEPLPPGPSVVARLPAPPRRGALRPRLVAEERFDAAPGEPVLPRAPSFVAARAVSVASEDVSIPPPLTILARPTVDRVALDDFTTEASTEAVLAAPLPRRERPAPFAKAAVPEPFEFRRPLTTPAPEEATTPVADGPAPPKP